MGVRTVTLPNGATIRIRPYRPGDHDQVIRIFSQGMLGLVPGGVSHIIRSSRKLQIMTCAAPAAALVVTPRRCSFLFKAATSIGAAAIVPCLFLGLLRRAMKRYVLGSINGPDLSDIETFYSTAGAGHGSAFWVAELIEQEPLMTAAPDAALQPAKISTLASTASSQNLLVTEKAVRANQASINLERAPMPSPAALTVVTVPVAPEAMEGLQLATALSVGEQINMNIAVANDKLDVANEQSSPSALVSADAEKRQIRELVAGLVAAAVARFEGASASPSSSPRATAPPEATPSTSAGEGVDVKTDGTDKPAALDIQQEPAPSPQKVYSTVSVPGAPAVVVNETHISSSLESSVQSTVAGKTPPVNMTGPPAPIAKEPWGASLVTATEPLSSPPSGGGSGSGRLPKIIGHVALERKSWKLAELRRMSVLKQYAGQGVGGQLLETLVQHARDNGFRELVLHTSGMQPAARRLYERGGWGISKVSRVQVMDVYTYTLDLTKKR